MEPVGAGDLGIGAGKGHTPSISATTSTRQYLASIENRKPARVEPKDSTKPFGGEHTVCVALSTTVEWAWGELGVIPGHWYALGGCGQAMIVMCLQTCLCTTTITWYVTWLVTWVVTWCVGFVYHSNGDFDSKHGLNVVVLGIATSTHCEEDSCLTSVESGKKALVFKWVGQMRMDHLPHHQIVIAYIP